ncbi:THAP domain-containing protein 3-like [Anguilla anguilla]|uniref:THAP domain-containing protein 3-like n=1 Tax=Anguilla anguilla TaxID=7936 RepID=UPI0015AF3C25|nr:THAP domain-containing protein 3-like [Anguilla anguilla]
MPKSCSAYNCTNRYNSKNPDLTFHRFPFSKPSVLKEWLHNIGREDFQPKRHMVICSHHFTPESFSGLGNRKNLLWNAVPTLFTFPASSPKKKKSRKKCKKDVTLGFQQWEEMLLDETNCQQEPGPQEVAAPVLANNDEHIAEQQLTSLTQDCGSCDHSYALSDACETKVRLFSTLDANRRLCQRLKVKCQAIRHLRLKLRDARRELAGLRAGRDCVRTSATRADGGGHRK